MLALPEPGGAGNGNGRAASFQLAESALASALRAEATPALVATNGQVVALIPGMDEEALFALAERVADRVGRELSGQQIRVGVGRAVAVARGAAQLSRGALHARGALTRAGRTRGQDRHLPRPRLVPAAALTAGRRGAEALLRLDPRADRAKRGGITGGQSMCSLEAFIEENGQWERAAKRLFCHRHTLRYRIRRVEELTGRDLGSARDRIEFWLALRGRELS